jgi:hypothetical protein
MGLRFGRVSVIKSRFKFIPSQLESVATDDSFEFTQAYSKAHELVFQQKPGKVDVELAAKIRAVAAELEAELGLFLTVNMWAFKQANPQGKFWPTMISGEAAKNRYARYKGEVTKIYGALGTSTFSRFSGLEDEQARLVRSEVTAGRWIVGYKTARGGLAWEPLMKALELELDPLWLATQDEYYNFIVKWAAGTVPKGTEVQAKKRHEVRNVVLALKRDKLKATSAFAARELAMKPAIDEVFSYLRLDPGLFLASGETVWESNVKFWSRLALAIQHYHCLKLVQGIDSRINPALLTGASL